MADGRWQMADGKPRVGVAISEAANSEAANSEAAIRHPPRVSRVTDFSSHATHPESS
jgi:hypothetical protein